jgi:hypothetical protein
MATFNFSFDTGTSLQQMTGFQVAGQIWSSYLKDNLTVNIHVGVSSNLPKGVIGGALPGIQASQNYKNVVSGLVNDAKSSDDFSSTSSLQTKAEYEAQFDAFDLKNGNNKGSRVKTKSINLTSANAKSINMGGGNSTDLDGVILLNSLSGTHVNWDYDFTRSSATSRQSLDFLSTAMHEIAHVLGFVSGVDKPGWLNSQGGDKGSVDLYKKSLNDRIANTTTLDLFRYSTAAGAGINDLSYGSAGADKFFSIDGGKTSIAKFSTGEDRSLGGDGEQASHWKTQGNHPVGIMSPTLERGIRMNIAGLDLRALDVMGWDVDANALNTPIDWSKMVAQAKQQLADRLGQTVTWLDSNSSLAAQNLSQNRDQDVSKMIAQSQIYKWDPGDDDPFWQKIQSLYFQQGMFQKLAPEMVAYDRPTIEITWESAELTSTGRTTMQPTVLTTVAAFENPAMLSSHWTGVEMPDTTVADSYRQLAGSNPRQPQSTQKPKNTQESGFKIKDLDLI